jgi:hypothetical protein
MTDKELEQLAALFWAEHTLWTHEYNSETERHEIRREGVVRAYADDIQSARALLTQLRKRASARVLLKSGLVVEKPLPIPTHNLTLPATLDEILEALDLQAKHDSQESMRPELSTLAGRSASAIRQLLKQRKQLLPQLLRPWQFVPAEFLEDVAAGRRGSNEITPDLALAILAARNLDRYDSDVLTLK